MDIFQKSITPDKPRVLAEEQIYVYVPMATSTNAGIASYNRDQFDIIGSEVSLKWPAESFTQGPIETPSIVKVLDNEFEYTGNLVDLISGNSKISSDKLEVQLKRILRDAYERPELVMLDPNYFVRTIVEKDGKQYYKYNTTAIHYNMSQNLSEDEQAQARQNISASSILDNDATNKRIDALLQTGVYSINGKTGNVVLKNSDLENDTNYATEQYVQENGGKIDKILLNDNEQQIVNKTVNLKVDKTTVGLSNVDNTSDTNKPVSIAQANAINQVQSNLDEHLSNYGNPHSVTKEQIGLGNVDNTSDKNKPISTKTQTALNTKMDKSGGIFTGNVGVQGNLSVSGTTITKDTETLKVQDNVIVTNANKIELLDLSGLAINKNDTQTYGIMYDAVDDSVKLGLGSIDSNDKFTFNEGEGSPVATRSDSSLLTDNHLLKWDATNNKLVDSGYSAEDKLDKISKSSTHQMAYIVDTDGSQNSIAVSITSTAPKESLIKRDKWGCAEVDTPGYSDVGKRIVNQEYVKTNFYTRADDLKPQYIYTDTIYNWHHDQTDKTKDAYSKIDFTPYSTEILTTTKDDEIARIKLGADPRTTPTVNESQAHVDISIGKPNDYSTGITLSNNYQDILGDGITIYTYQNALTEARILTLSANGLFISEGLEINTETQTAQLKNKKEISPNTIRYDIEQTLTDEQKAQARANIGAARDVNVTNHINDTQNPHQVTKAQIGLGNVDNTSDLDKPISNAVRAALNDYLLIANIDSSLNNTSTNPVQNKIVTEALNNRYTKSETYSQQEIDNLIGSGSSITVDNALSKTSENPVQNKVLYDPVMFAESEREKSKNLFNATRSEITDYSMTYSADTSKLYISGTYTDGARCQFGTWPLKKGTYTLCIKFVSGSMTRFNTIKFFLYKGNSWTQYAGCPDISSTNLNVSVTFTLDEDVSDATLMLYQNLSNNTMTDCVFQYQIVTGSVPDFDFQPYNGAIVRDKQLNEQLSNYLPLSGGTLTGQLKLASIPKVNDVNVALLSDLNSYLPLSGGTMAGAILFPNTATYSSTDIPTALSYGRLQAFGTLNINGNTDNSGTEYVNITAGHGCSSSTADGLSIGTDTLTWKDQPVALTSDIAMGDNFTTYTVIDATALDENTWYPVTFDASRKNLKIMLFNQWNGGTPSWATHSTKNYGCVKIWETTGNGWGELGVYRKVYLSVFTYVNTDPVRGIGQLGNSSTEYVYVRGGGKYNFYTSHNVVPVLRTSTYTVSSQSVEPTTTAPAEIVQTIMSTDTAQTISGSKTFTNGLTVSGRVLGSGDDEGIVVSPAYNNYAGICLGNPSGKRAVFYLTSDDNSIWRFSTGSSKYDICHPKKAGTIALTSDIPNLLDKVYPVGSIYMSTKNNSPASFLGGTWLQLKDTFLLAHGDTYTSTKSATDSQVTSEAGEATHTLTIAEMPSHNHNTILYYSGGSGPAGVYGKRDKDARTYTSTSTGGSSAHNNMPPYLVVYMWKRTA